MATDYDNDIALLANTPAQAETQLHCLEWAAAVKGLHVNVDKTEYMCCKQFWTSPGSNTPQKHQLYGHLPPIMKTIKVRWTRHLQEKRGHMDEQRQDDQLKQQLCANTGYGFEDIPRAMDDRDGWRERARDIRAGSAIWWWYMVWWWWWWMVA